LTEPSFSNPVKPVPARSTPFVRTNVLRAATFEEATPEAEGAPILLLLFMTLILISIMICCCCYFFTLNDEGQPEARQSFKKNQRPTE